MSETEQDSATKLRNMPINAAYRMLSFRIMTPSSLQDISMSNNLKMVQDRATYNFRPVGNHKYISNCAIFNDLELPNHLSLTSSS